MAGEAQKILVLGGGYGGFNAARTLQRSCRDRFTVTVVEPSPYMTYQPLLPEVAGGHVQPADVTIPLHRALRHCRIVRGSVIGMDTAAKQVVVRRIDGNETTLSYDQVIVAIGAVTRVLPTAGLKDFGIGFKSVEEAVFLHNQVLEQLSIAANTDDVGERRRAMTFVFVGAGYTGVEALTELQKLSILALKGYPFLKRSELRWFLIEAQDRVAPEVGPKLSTWSLGTSVPKESTCD